jgi:hypothetical protein
LNRKKKVGQAGLSASKPIVHEAQSSIAQSSINTYSATSASASATLPSTETAHTKPKPHFTFIPTSSVQTALASPTANDESSHTDLGDSFNFSPQNVPQQQISSHQQSQPHTSTKSKRITVPEGEACFHPDDVSESHELKSQLSILRDTVIDELYINHVTTEQEVQEQEKRRLLFTSDNFNREQYSKQRAKAIGKQMNSDAVAKEKNANLTLQFFDITTNCCVCTISEQVF